MRFLVISIAILAIAGCSKPQPQQPANETQASAEAGPTRGVDRSHKGQLVPNIEILDAMSIDTGSTTNLRQLQDGQPMLVNLWASWCAPCVKELPTLQKLAEQKGSAMIVVPISQDSGPQRSVETFLYKLNLDFVAYQDPKMNLSGALGPDAVLPTTILYDAKGKEVWRYVGDLDWTGPEAARLLSEAGAPAKG